jgi:hypothetical protein
LDSKVLPSAGIIIICGVMVLNILALLLQRPLNTDKIIISAALPTKTPSTEIIEMILMAFVDFFAKRYLRAI